MTRVRHIYAIERIDQKTITTTMLFSLDDARMERRYLGARNGGIANYRIVRFTRDPEKKK